MKEYKHCNHQFPIFIDSESKILILGSFPSVKSREKNFYYMHPQNRFYKILDKLFNCDMYHQDIDYKKEMLKKYRIALYDVIESCDILNSSDATIKHVKYIDLERILNEHNIVHIFLNGNKAYQLFIKKFPKFIYMATPLPSTSSANSRMKFEEILEKYKMINEFI